MSGEDMKEKYRQEYRNIVSMIHDFYMFNVTCG